MKAGVFFAILTVFLSGLLLISTNYSQVVEDKLSVATDKLSIETGALETVTERVAELEDMVTGRVAELEDMVERDDVLLLQFTHGTWSRDCEYELVAGVLLADNSIKSSLIQTCEEEQ
jgi:hypothetical protein